MKWLTCRTNYVVDAVTGWQDSGELVLVNADAIASLHPLPTEKEVTQVHGRVPVVYAKGSPEQVVARIAKAKDGEVV